MVPRIIIAPCSRMHDYEEAMRRAGAEVEIEVIDRSATTPEAALSRADGLLLAGGNDVLPSLYGEASHAAFEAAEPGRDEYEVELVRLATERDLPLLAICRGIQVLNVARSGTLVQDIASELETTIEHMVRQPPCVIGHDVWMAAGSRLQALMGVRLDGSDVCPVNSRHHQAVKDIGKNLVVTATAPDGVIEAIEDPSLRFCLGVQWHPENFYRTGEFSALFGGLVEAAVRFRS
jgi:putative glutamine amidotransferase